MRTIRIPGSCVDSDPDGAPRNVLSSILSSATAAGHKDSAARRKAVAGSLVELPVVTVAAAAGGFRAFIRSCSRLAAAVAGRHQARRPRSAGKRRWMAESALTPR